MPTETTTNISLSFPEADRSQLAHRRRRVQVESRRRAQPSRGSPAPTSIRATRCRR